MRTIHQNSDDSDTTMRLDTTRLLLAFKEPHTLKDPSLSLRRLGLALTRVQIGPRGPIVRGTGPPQRFSVVRSSLSTELHQTRVALLKEVR